MTNQPIIIRLNRFEQDQYDPSGNIRNILGMIPREESYYAPLPTHIEGLDVEEVLHIMESHHPEVHQPYVQYQQEMFSKTGRQGGAITYSQLQDLVRCYYEHPTFDGAIPSSLLRARDYLIRLIKMMMEVRGGPQLDIPQHYPTFSGAPAGIHKGQFHSETLGFQKVCLQRFEPTVPGMRRMRGKDRSIFMDANTNIRAMERYMTGARNWLKKNLPYFFGAWLREDVVVQPSLTHGVDRHLTSIEWDYKSMDMRFTKRIAMELIYPIYEVLYPDLALSIGCHFEQCFEQSVFWGDEMWTGLHTLLSGAIITNDFETLYSVILWIAVCLDNGLIPENEIFVALGDDVTAMIKRSKRVSPEKLLNYAIDLSNLVSMIISPEKSRVSDSDARFCRKVYYERARRTSDSLIIGAYPTVLAVNNICCPEFPQHEAATAFWADIQRLDGTFGSPDWNRVAHMYAQSITFKLDDEFLHAIRPSKQNVCWWERLYGTKYDPRRSPSLAMIAAFAKRGHVTPELREFFTSCLPQLKTWNPYVSCDTAHVQQIRKLLKK